MTRLCYTGIRYATPWAAGLVGCLTVFSAQAQADEPAVTPYRPSVSTPAALSAPGWLELEAGAQGNRGNGLERRQSLPYTLKYAFSPDWGVRLGGEALVRQTDADNATASGGGDTSLVLKRRFALDSERAFGLELGVNLATAPAGLGADRSAWSLNSIYSADIFGNLHTDLNLGASRSMGSSLGLSRTTKAAAASLSGPFDARWGWVAEVSGTHQGGAGGSTQGLAAVSYSLSRATSLDFGLAKSLRSGSPDRSIFAGMTVLLGKPF